MPKLTMNLTETEIKEYIKKAVETETNLPVAKVNLTYHQGYSDPREYSAPTVTATVEFRGR